MAQQSETKEIFKPHWTLGIQAGVSETRGEVKFSDLLSPAVAGYVGYRFTPVVGVRVGACACNVYWTCSGLCIRGNT